MTRIPKNYKPTRKEKFMNAKMKEYFRQILINWKDELLKESSHTLNNLQNNENSAKPDLTDRASDEIDRTFELRTRDRERKLINKIEAALKRIEDGNYGYCEETGEPISLKRLQARPVATLSLEAQENHEKNVWTPCDSCYLQILRQDEELYQWRVPVCSFHLFVL